jgi:hypothetical protein
VGVIVDGWAIAAWRHRAIWELVHENGAPAVAVLLEGAPVPAPRSRVFRAYAALDRRLFGSARDPEARVDARPLLSDCPLLDARAVAAGTCFAVPPATLEALRAQSLDVLLQLGGGRLEGDALGVARLGLWVFAHDEDARAGRAPLWEEIARGEIVTETRLVARTPAGETTLYRSHASTQPNSLVRNRGGACWKSADFPSRAVRAFSEGREPPFDGGLTIDAPLRAPRPPRARDVVRFAATATRRVARNRARLRRADRVWFLAARRHGGVPFETAPLTGFEALPCPGDRFHADPILVHDGARHHLFFEDADRRSGLGVIAWREIGRDGRAGPSQVVLAAEHHLSYPFVFRWRDAWWMIPETSEKRTVEIHRAVEFPLRWQLEKVLFHDVAAVDATIHEQDGRLWMFVGMSRGGAALGDELYLFHAESPLGDWIPHPWNPIVSDVRRARPAGPLYRSGGALWRPGQDSAGDYGAALWLNRVDVLDERAYRETPVRRIDPDWVPGGMCTHTYVRAGDFELLDGRVWMPRRSGAGRSW